MNKFFIGILFFLNSLYLQADTLTVSQNQLQTLARKTRVDQDNPIENLKFTPGFKESYKNKAEFNYSSAAKTDNLWTQIKNGISRWLDRIFNSEAADTPKQLWNTALEYFSVVLLIGLIAFVIRMFIKKEAFWFFKKSKKPFEIHTVEMEKDLEKTNFKSLIKIALANDDHRLAIRYYYLWLLKALSKNAVIKWDLEKTNSDYLSEIKDAETRKSFQYLSYLYNNIWYGEFAVDPLEFEKAQQAFESFLKRWSDE